MNGTVLLKFQTVYVALYCLLQTNSQYLHRYCTQVGIFYLYYPVLTLYDLGWKQYFPGSLSLGANILKTVIGLGICILVTRILKKIPIIKILIA